MKILLMVAFFCGSHLESEETVGGTWWSVCTWQDC